jgi:proteasome assembly chaperone (PAC2) family protein
MSDPIVMLHKPSLREPLMLVGFGGWPNAGEVSTWVITYLLRNSSASKCAEIRPEIFYDLVQQRPVVSIEGGRVQSVQFPGNAFYCASAVGPAGSDLVLFLGQEPNFQWPRFSEALLDVAQQLGVSEIFTVGGLYDNIPHTVEPRVTGLTNAERRLASFPTLGIRAIDYAGPMSIHTHLLVASSQRKIPATSLWGHVPYYIQSNNAKTCLAILERLQRLTGLQWDLKDVRRASELLDEEIDRIIQSKPELREYIQGLEADYASGEKDANASARPARPQPSGEKIIRIDPFLRKG